MALLNGKTMLSGALSLTAVLAWNDAMKATVESFYPADKKGGAHAMVAYAIVATIIVIVVVGSINLCARHIAKIKSEGKMEFQPHDTNIFKGPVFRLMG